MLKKYCSLVVLVIYATIADGQIGNLVVPTGHTSAVNKTIISPDKRYAYTISEDVVTMWDIKRQLQMYSIRHGLQYKTTIAKLSPDGNYLAVADLSRIAVYSTVNGKQVSGKLGRGTYSLMFSADSKTFYYVGDPDAEWGKRYPWSGIVAKNILTGAETKIIGCTSDPVEKKSCPLNYLEFSPLSDSKVYIEDYTNKGWKIVDLVSKQFEIVKPASYRTLDNFFDSTDKKFRPIFNSGILLSVEREKTKSYNTVAFYDAYTGKIITKFDVSAYQFEIKFGCDQTSFVVDYGEESDAYQYQVADIKNGQVKPKLLKKGAPIYAECNMKNKFSVFDYGVTEFNDSTQILQVMGKDSVLKEVDMSRMVGVGHKVQKPVKGADASLQALSRNGKWILRYESYFDAKGNGLDRYQLYNTKSNTSQRVNAAFLTSPGSAICYFSNDENHLYVFTIDHQYSGTLYKIDLRSMASRQIKKYQKLKAVNETQEYAVALVGTALELFDINSGRSVTAKFSLKSDYTFMFQQDHIATHRNGDSVFIKDDKKLVGLSWQTGAKLADSDEGFDYDGLTKIFPSKTVIDSASFVHSKRLIDGRPGMFFSSDRKLIYTLSSDNSIGVFDSETGHFYGQMYLFDGSNDWVFMDPEGRFDGTPGGMKQLYFLKDRNIIPLDLVFEKYYTPNLYQRLLAGEEFPPIPEINIKPKPSTKIMYAEKQRNLEVEDDKPTYANTSGVAEITVQATAPEDQVEEIRLFHNGKVVTLATRGMLVTDNDGADSRKYTINLLPGINSFRAVALNSQRTESDADEITVNFGSAPGVPTPSTKPIMGQSAAQVDMVDRNATLHLVMVGINQYQNPKMNLNYALADATALKEELEKDAKTVLGTVKTYFITDANATTEGIQNAFKQVQSTAKASDVFVFYYAGHGIVSSQNKEFYLVPTNVSNLSNVDAELAEKGIASKLLQQFAIEIPAQKQVFILDACQSAGAFEQMLQQNGDQQKSLALVARSTGTHWLAASGSQQYANEFSSLGHGAFTYVLLNALKGEAAANKMITVYGLRNFLQKNVPELLKKYGGTPQYPASYGFGNDFPVEVLK